jgi:hypothetical protein
MVETRNAYKDLVEKPEGKRPPRRHTVGGKIILKLILNGGWSVWAGFNAL